MGLPIKKEIGKPECGDDVQWTSGNSDANCFRKRYIYAIRLVSKNPGLCTTCIYNKMHKRLKLTTKPEQKVFFTSDWHLGHHNILAKDGRPFATIQEHDQRIIKNWNNSIENVGNIGFILGDLALTSKTKLQDYCAQLHGTIYYVQGNHDHTKDLNVIGRYFEILSPLQEIEINGQLIVLCHYSLQVWNRHHRGSWHLFGHSHGGLKNVHGKKMDVGINTNHYMPYNLGEVSYVMASKEAHAEDHHTADLDV